MPCFNTECLGHNPDYVNNCGDDNILDESSCPNFVGRPGAALADVLQECEEIEARWGEQNHAPAAWLMILGEEVGEANKAALENHFRGESVKHYRAELVQVAAVALTAIESFDRQLNA